MKSNKLKYKREWEKLTKTEFEAAVWLHENRKQLKPKSGKKSSFWQMLGTLPQDEDVDPYEYFDYPDYCGMPKKLSNKLSGDLVDRIQENWDEIRSGPGFGHVAAWVLGVCRG